MKLPRNGVETTRTYSQLVGLAAGLVCGAALGAATSLDPAQVTCEFIQRSWQKRDGLPDDQVQCLVQTRDGYLWVGTKSGLARFDGLKFTVFNRANTPLLESDDCQSLEEDAQGNLWISTRSALLRFGNQELRRFGTANGLCGGPSFGTYPSKRGELWMISGDWLTRFNHGKLTCYSEANGLLGRISALNEDDAGRLWIGFNHGLQWFDPQTATFSTNCIPAQWRHTMVQCLLGDARGKTWASFVETVDLPGEQAPALKQWVHWFADGRWQSCPGNPHGNDGRPFFILPDHDGNMWMPAGQGRLLRLREGKFDRFELVGEGRNSPAQCALADREGNLWFGTESGGLQRWTPRKIEAFVAREGLPHDNAWTICEGRDGAVWIGTDGGLSRFKDGKFASFGEREGLTRKEVRSVAEENTGTLWVGTMSGLFAFRDGKFTKHEFPGKWFEGKVRVVLPARDGSVWVGTARGLNRLREGEHTKFSLSNGLAQQDVRALLEDHEGNLWIGTAGGGVQRLRDGIFTTIAMTNGLSANSVWALHEDAAGTMWIGTENGLNRLRNGQITVFTTREGLPDNLVNYILEDDFGRLWLSHDHGIYWVRKQDLESVAVGRIKTVQCVTYDESDGLPSLETNGQKSNPAGCKTRDGRLWFPTTKGVAVIDPSKADLDTIPPLSAIELVRANGGVVFDNGPNSANQVEAKPEVQTGKPKAEIAATDARRSTITHQFAPGSARVLEFRYTANTFVAPEKTRFKYRMLGVDDHWIDAGTRREAYFTDLPSGDYQFEVIAGNHHGVWQERGVTFAFHIAPFLYQTWWFYLLCGGAAAGLIAGLVIWRMRELRKIHRLEQQSAIADERARIAKDLHDGLVADLTRLALLADLTDEEGSATAAGHRQKLSQSSRDAARTLKEMIWMANPANDMVDSLVSRVCQSAEDFLRDARIRCRFDVPPDLPRQPLTIDQCRNLLLVAREALNNIVKHAAATEVCIRAKGGGNNLLLEIEDNGRGFDSALTRPDALGLASMRRRIENLGGTFELDTRPGVGTKIVINITWKKSS